MSDAERVMRIYDEHVPGSREAYLNDPTTHYARSMMRYLLAIAEIAMRTEQIPEDVRFRILMTMAVGQPSTPVDAEHRQEITKQLLAAQGASPPRLKPFSAVVGHKPEERTPECCRRTKGASIGCILRPGHGPKHFDGLAEWYDYNLDE